MKYRFRGRAGRGRFSRSFRGGRRRRGSKYSKGYLVARGGIRL